MFLVAARASSKMGDCSWPSTRATCAEYDKCGKSSLTSFRTRSKGTSVKIKGQTLFQTGNGRSLRGSKVHPEDPTGNVTWSANTGCAPSALSGNPGIATCTTAVLAVGGYLVTATYAGDSNHTGNSGSIDQTVNQASTGTSVSSSLDPSTYGQSVG